MNRLQKKCFIAVAGTHLLAVVVLLCSGFISSTPKPDNTPVLDMIPANLIDAAFNSGVRGAKPPPPMPVAQPQPEQPTPTPPQPVVKEVEPTKPVEPEKAQPEETKPDEHTETKPKHEVTPDLTKVVHKKTTETDNSEAEAKAAKEAAKEAKRLHDARVKAFQNAARSIKENSSSSTTIDMPGDSTVAYANYATVVKSVYTQAWRLPDNTASDEANVKVSVTIANDGRVIEAHMVERSDDSSVNSSVQRTLDRVKDIAPFPDGSTDKERTYIINFNLKAKRQMLG